MLLRCQCPSCGETKEYIAEQVGTAMDCFRCGHRLTLLGNPGRVAGHVIIATLAVMALVGGFFSRAYLRSQRWERAYRDRPANTVTFTFPGTHTERDDG